MQIADAIKLHEMGFSQKIKKYFQYLHLVKKFCT